MVGINTFKTNSGAARRSGVATASLVACALAAMVAPPARADVKAGVDAWSAGNFDAAVKEWKPLAAKGDADAQFNLAQAYKMGRGVPLDLAMAEELYGKAASQGHLQASDTYGLLLFQRGERAKAMPYIEASAARGDPRAQYILGVAHFNGDLVAKDWVRAYALVSLAQQAGLPQATNALAQMNEHIPLAQRQESVPMAAKISGVTEATRQRLATAAELGMPTDPVSAAAPAVAPAPLRPPQIVSADRAVIEAVRTAGGESPASAGADYARPAFRPQTPTKAPGAAPPQVAARKPAAPAPAAAATPAPAPPPARPAATSGPWRVQLGAFGVAANADALWAKLRGRPELAGHGKLTVPAGKLVKLQAGGFATKGDADAACARLSATGQACMAVHE